MRDRRMKRGLILSYGFLIFVMLTHAGNSIAQDTVLPVLRKDSGWIERFNSDINVKVALINTADAFVVQTEEYNYIFQPNPAEIFRAYVNYRFISFYVNYIPHFLPGNNDDNEKGHTRGIGLGTNLNFRNWFTELYFSHNKGHYLENTKDFQPDWHPGDPYFQIPALHIIRWEGTTGYNTNPRHSLPATTSQTERQLKSAGSFIPRIAYKYDIIDNRTVPITTFTQKTQNIQLLLGAGYQHTFVIKKLWYILGGFTPSFGYIFYKGTTRTPTGNSSFNSRGPVYQWDGKFGAGYNGHRFFAGSYLTANSAKYAQGLTTAVNQEVSIFFQLFAGIRLTAPRFINQKIEKVFH